MRFSLTICINSIALHTHKCLDKQVHERNGDDEHTDDIEYDTRLDHLRDGDIARSIDNGIWRSGHRQHEGQ